MTTQAAGAALALDVEEACVCSAGELDQERHASFGHQLAGDITPSGWI